MSADNAVAILITLDRDHQTRPGCFQRLDPLGCPVYRVAHISNPEAFSDISACEFHNLGHWMATTFARARVFLNADDAQKAARELADSLPVLEYGIVHYDARPLNFPEH